jgi:hypothetical protein
MARSRKIDYETILYRVLNESYNLAGADIAIEMKKNMGDGATGRTHDSITFATESATDRKLVGSKAESKDIISKAAKGELKIGTAVPYAIYEEYGAAAMNGSVGSAEAGGSFRERIEEWAILKFGEVRGKELAGAIATSIAENGTPGKPFVGPTIGYAEKRVGDILIEVMRKDFGKTFAVPIRSTVDVDISGTGWANKWGNQ